MRRTLVLLAGGVAATLIAASPLLARQAAPGLGLELVVRPIAEAREMDQNLTLLSDVDAIYLPTDNKIVASIDTILQMTESKKIPLVVGEGDSVRKGGIVTYGLDYTKLGYQTGEMAIRILKDGAAPATLPVETQKDLQIYVNKAAAERMGVTIPESLLAKAEVVG